MTNIFTMVYPWSVKDLGLIVPRLDRVGRRVKSALVESVPMEVIAQHYNLERGRPFYETFVTDMAGKPVWVAHYIGNIQTFKELKIELRREMAPFEELEKEIIHRNGVLHTSMSAEEFANNYGAFRKYLEVGQQHLLI